MAAHQVVLVPEVGEQEQARVLDSPRRDHDVPRSHLEAPAAECGDTHALDTRGLRRALDAERVGVEEHANAPCVAERCTVGDSEPRRRAELEDDGRERLVRGEQRSGLGRAGPALGSVVVRTELAELLRSLVVSVEVTACNRPAALGHPLALLEIGCVERPAPTLPMPCRAAERPHSRLRRGCIRMADDLAVV